MVYGFRSGGYAGIRIHAIEGSACGAPGSRFRFIMDSGLGILEGGIESWHLRFRV